MRSIYGALMDNGMAMADVDRVELGLYLQIVRERAQRRLAKKRGGAAGSEAGGGKNAVYLRRGTIDELFG